EVVRARERLALGVRVQHSDLLAAGTQLRKVVAIVTGNEQILAAWYQAAGAAAILVPEELAASAVPGLDVARRVFDVQEPAVAPQRAFRVVSVAIDDRDLPSERAGPGRCKQACEE